MTNAPADKIAVALKVAVLTVGGTEDFSVSHGNGRLFRYDQFCDKYPSILFRIAICRRQTAALKSDRFGIFFACLLRLVLGGNLEVALVLGVVCIRVKGFFCGSAASALLWLFRYGNRRGQFLVGSWHHAPLQH